MKLSKVVAKTEGPKYNGSTIGCLTPGKEYEVLSIHYKKDGVWIDEPFVFNPIGIAQFYLKVLDDNNRHHHIWNDYFYPTEIEYERVRKINEILDYSLIH